MSEAKAQLIKVGVGTYLTGRKLNPAFLLFLVARDLLLRPFLAISSQPVPDMSAIRNVAVCVPDHLGDLLMTLPALKVLRALAPQARIILVVGEWTQALAEFLQATGIVDDVVIYNLALLDRSKTGLFTKFRHQLQTRAKALPVLREKDLDLFFDMRAYSPNAWGIARSSARDFGLGLDFAGWPLPTIA